MGGGAPNRARGRHASTLTSAIGGGFCEARNVRGAGGGRRNLRGNIMRAHPLGFTGNSLWGASRVEDAPTWA